MTHTHHNPLTSVVLSLLLILDGTHVAIASEVTGTLSSDGSTNTQQESTMRGANAERNATASAAVAQNGGQIQGSVIQGRDEPTTAAAAHTATSNMSLWVAVSAGVALIILGFALWRRRGV